MGEIVITVYALTILGGIWAIVRLFRYSFGAYSDYIHVPWLAWVSLIVGIWVPFLNFIVLVYILFGCKSINALMKAREQAINELTPKDVVEATEQLILNNSLVGDEWVVGTWNKTSKSDWIERLSSKPTLLKQSLEQKLKIHASKVQPYAEWVNIIKHFIYLEEREQVNAKT